MSESYSLPSEPESLAGLGAGIQNFQSWLGLADAVSHPGLSRHSGRARRRSPLRSGGPAAGASRPAPPGPQPVGQPSNRLAVEPADPYTCIACSCCSPYCKTSRLA